MNNNNYPFPMNGQPPQIFNQLQQIQQMFPQPQGSVYQINTPAEVGNVPIGSTGLSVAICFQDSIMYIKSFQSGNPIIMAYKIAPYSKEQSVPTPAVEEAPKDPMEDRISRLENLLTNLTKDGGKFNGLL